MLGPGLQRLKARYTYPRIGYARVPGDDPRNFGTGVLVWIVGVFALAGAVLLVGGQLVDNLAWRRMAPAIAGALFAGGFVDLYRRSGLVRFLLLAAASAVSGGLMVVPDGPRRLRHAAHLGPSSGVRLSHQRWDRAGQLHQIDCSRGRPAAGRGGLR